MGSPTSSETPEARGRYTAQTCLPRMLIQLHDQKAIQRPSPRRLVVRCSGEALGLPVKPLMKDATSVF